MMDVMAAASSTAEERGTRCREYLQALEEERRKIEAFQRELPLTLHLVTQAIECYRQQMSAEVFPAGCAVRSKLQEATEEEVACEGAPVLEEFIPIKRSSSSEAGDEEEAGEGRPQRDHHRSSHGGHDDEDSSGTSKQQETSCEKRPDWLRSVQLWSHHPDPRPLPREEEHAMDMNPRRPSVAVEVKKATTGAFLPFHSQKRSPPPAAVEAAAPVPAPTPAVPATSSTSDTVGGCGSGGGKSGCSGGGDEKDGQPHRKARRSWSPELHRRFLGALHQLGGSDVATPKRIRELMKVDSLTNDEVKSHLQKYRLHSRRPSPTSHANAGSSPPHQVVFVGGIWVPPPEYAAAAAAAAVAAARPPSEGIPAGPPSAIYAPIATVPAPKQRQQQQVKQPQWSPAGGDVRCVAGEGATTRSHSPATSSSSRTTTSSPVRRR